MTNRQSDGERLLILNGSVSEITLIEKAKEMGFYTITTGNNPSLPGHAYADEYIPADYSDMKTVLDIVVKHNISRIVSCANDFGVITASYVAEQLNLPGHDTYKNAVTIHHKDRFKELTKRLGIPSPLSHYFDSYDSAYQYALSAEYPLIIKSVDLTGGKGVERANNITEACKAIKRSIESSRMGRIVIEPYIVGTQQSIDTFVINGKVVASVSNDCYMPINPFLIQSETLPAKNIDQIEGQLHSIIELICKELSLVDGMFTLQYIVKDGQPYVIEAMRRCLGNQFLTVAHAVSGFPWEEALIRAETGLGFEGLTVGEPTALFAGHHGVMGHRNGVIAGYHVLPELEKHIFKRIDMIHPGERIDNYLNERVAYLYYAFDNREEMDKIARHLNDYAVVDYI